MARAAKTLEAMRSNPRDWRIETLETVAAAFGVNCRKPGGSHVIFEHPAVIEALSGAGAAADQANLRAAFCPVNRGRAG